MKLPCRHILAARAEVAANLFDETLCDKCWSVKYYKESQRIFSNDEHDDNPCVEIVQLSAPKKRTLSQEKMQLASYALNFYACVV